MNKAIDDRITISPLITTYTVDRNLKACSCKIGVTQYHPDGIFYISKVAVVDEARLYNRTTKEFDYCAGSLVCLTEEYTFTNLEDVHKEILNIYEKDAEG